MKTLFQVLGKRSQMAWKLPLDHKRKFKLFDLQCEHQQHQEYGWLQKCFILFIRQEIQ